jgi:hypothetical protein
VSSNARAKRITIIGAGAVGGWASFMLGKTGYIHQDVYDFDMVGEENVGPQLFSFSQVGMPKVSALAKTLLSWCKARITPIPRPWDNDHIGTPYVIAAADSMEVRKKVFNKCRGKNLLLIDTRMGAELITMYAVNCANEEDCADYALSLYSDSDAVQEACTEKATAYTAGLIGGLITKVIKDHSHGKRYTKRIVWDLSVNNYIQLLSEEL